VISLKQVRPQFKEKSWPLVKSVGNPWRKGLLSRKPLPEPRPRLYTRARVYNFMGLEEIGEWCLLTMS